jgi:hypothetical protein
MTHPNDIDPESSDPSLTVSNCVVSAAISCEVIKSINSKQPTSMCKKEKRSRSQGSKVAINSGNVSEMLVGWGAARGPGMDGIQNAPWREGRAWTGLLWECGVHAVVDTGEKRIGSIWIHRV